MGIEGQPLKKYLLPGPDVSNSMRSKLRPEIFWLRARPFCQQICPKAAKAAMPRACRSPTGLQ